MAPLVEKYRPRSLDEVIGNEHLVSRFKTFANKGNIPNMIVCGSSGTGKTVCVDALVRTLHGDLYVDATLRFSASDTGDVDFVRGTIKTFAKQKMALEEYRHKIIIVDEAEYLQNPSQQAIKRIMELYSATTRFIFVCNTSSRVIEPIQSRCAIIRFSRLEDRFVRERIVTVCEKESIVFTDTGVSALVFTADGDMRSALCNLESTHKGTGFISEENVYRMCDCPSPSVVEEILGACLKEDYQGATKSVRLLKGKGYSSHDMMGTFFRVCKDNNIGMSPSTRLRMLKEVSEAHVRVTEGLVSDLQIVRMCIRLCRCDHG